MAKVPNTNTFALTDVVPAITIISKGTISSVTNNGGTARFNISGSTGYLAVDDWVNISNTTYYNGLWQVTAVLLNTWFETTRPYIQPDSGLWERDMNTLVDCFDEALAGKFDPQYEGSKDRQSNFRNYGYTGYLTNVDNEDYGGYYYAAHGNSDWFFVTSGHYGVRCYDVSSVGVLDLKDTEGAPGNEHFNDIWIQSDKIFLTSWDGPLDKSYLRSYNYVALTGVILPGDVIDVGTFPGAATTLQHVFGDGTNLIFVVWPGGTSSFGIRSYTYDGSGNLTYKTGYTADSALYYDGIYVDGYLFVVGNNGITSFIRNTTTGVLTRVDNDNTGTFTGNSIVYDSANDLFFLGSQADGTIVYSHSSGILTQEYCQGSGLRRFLVHHSNNFVYCTDGSNVLTYRLNGVKGLDYIRSHAFGIYEQLYIWYVYAPNVLIALDGYDGMRTYLIA